MAVFSAQDCVAIEAAVAAAEARSAGEIVVAVLPRSAFWQLERARATAATLYLVGCLALWVAPQVSAQELFLTLLTMGFALWGASGFRVLLRLLISKGRARRAVVRRAHALFSSRRIYDTAQRTGVLILISELERQVVVLGDTAIDAALGAEGWQSIVDDITAGLHRGAALPALLQVLEHLGGTLATLLPARDAAARGLPNRPITTDEEADEAPAPQRGDS